MACSSARRTCLSARTARYQLRLDLRWPRRGHTYPAKPAVTLVLRNGSRSVTRAPLRRRYFDQHGITLATAGADGRDAEPAAATAQFVGQRQRDARPAHADRVA